mgnify:FL=1
MITYTEQGKKVLESFASECSDVAKVETTSRLENRQISITLSPIDNKKK